MKTWLLAFTFSFGFNLIWEQAHQGWYLPIHPMVTNNLAIFLAAFFDALVIVVLLAVLRSFKPWVLVVAGVLVAVVIEKIALGFGWWAYKEIMPVIPLINTGLSPTIQLGILSFAVSKIIFKNGSLRFNRV